MLVYAVMGIISGAIGAAVYNLFAGLVGGISVDVELHDTGTFGDGHGFA